MKKLLFGLIATIMFGFVGNAQEMTATSKKTALNAQVLTFVQMSKLSYTRGQKYEDFVASLLIPSPTFPSQEIFLKKIYLYVSNNTSDCDILNADTSDYVNFISDLSKNPANQAKSADPGKKKWWQILINVAINVGLDILVPGNTQNVDLFP